VGGTPSRSGVAPNHGAVRLDRRQASKDEKGPICAASPPDPAPDPGIRRGRLRPLAEPAD